MVRFLNEVIVELSDKKVTVLPNIDADTGIASSIKVATGWAKQSKFHALLLVACDQILVTEAHLSVLIDRWRETDSLIIASSYENSFGIPALFRREMFDELSSLEGDRGAKAVIATHREQTVLMPLPEAAVDVDVPADLHKVI